MWRYRLPGYELRLLEELQRQKHNSLYCDTLLQTDGLSVPAHSCILAALSPYLSKALSTQSSPLPAGQRWPLKLQAVKAQTLLKLVDLLYSGELEGEGTMEQEEVMAAACKLGIGRLVEGWKDRGREGGEERRCSLTEVGVQTEGGETQVDVGAFVETGTQTEDCNGGICMTFLSPLPGALPTSTHSPSPPNPPLLLVQNSSEGQQHTTPSAPRSPSPRIMTPTSHPSSTPPSVKAMVNGGTAPFRTHAWTAETEGYCTDVTNPSSSSVVLGSDHPTTPREKSAVPECSVTEKREHTGTGEGGGRRECLETECMRTRQLPHQSLHPPQFPALPRSSPLDTAFLTPPPDLPISPLRSHSHSTSNTTAQSISLNHCSSTHHPTPHPVHQPQLALPQPPVEESDEQIEKMLEDIMMGLNILPPMVLEKDCDRHHHLQSHDRPSACSCSHHPVHARHCGMHSAIGSASRCMCSQREGSDALSTETAFHSIISSHFVTTTTTCTVTPDLYLDPQPLTPHCSTPHPSTPHHHSHPHFSCNDYSSDWTECNRASYCSGVLQCSSENAKNHHELLVRFQNQNSQNQELQNRNSKSLVVGCGGSSSIIPVHSGPSPRPPHHHQSLPQSQASLPYTGEEDRDPGCWKGSSAQTGVPSTSKEYVCNLSSADCLSTNGETTPSQVNGDTTPSQVNGDSTPSQKCLLLPLESNNNSEQMTDGQDRASISNNSRLAGKEGEEEWKRKKVVTTTTGRRLEKPKAKRSEGDETLKPHSNRKRIRVRRKEGFEAEQGRRIEKLKAKTERSQGDETLNPPRNRTRIHERRTEGLKAEQEQSEDSETLEPRRKKRKRNVSTKIEVGDEDIKTERVKLNDGTKTENGQVKISICSVSLATNNVLASERLGRYLSNTSTTSTKSLSSLGEEANGPPEGIKRLRREMGNPVRVLRARDRDVKRPPNVWTATRSCSPVSSSGQCSWTAPNPTNTTPE
ncbi:unnamed protein product, partial [Coregonus sp. 'balchen']